jgi:hypothetical protein
MAVASDKLSLADIKARLFIPDVWRLLQLPGEPGKSCASPFRPDKRPSFSVFQNGERFRDHANGDSGTVIDFIQLALDVSLDGALKWAREQCGQVPALPKPSKTEPQRTSKPCPKLRPAKAGELEALAALRGYSLETLREAEACGLLAFSEVWGRVAWLVCDPGGRIAEGRRLDGKPWEAFGSMPERKCHAWGGQKNWPVNLEEVSRFPKLALVEGGPECGLQRTRQGQGQVLGHPESQSGRWNDDGGGGGGVKRQRLYFFVSNHGDTFSAARNCLAGNPD